MVIFALTLVRHGETGHNKDNVIQGQLDVPLSVVGVQQAQLLGEHLQHQKYTHIYASDLSRAKKTAEHILEKSQVCQVDITEDPRLRERKFGVVEGKHFKYLKEAAGRTNQHFVQYTPVGAETVQQVNSLTRVTNYSIHKCRKLLKEVQQRAIVFFRDLCQWMRETARKLLEQEHEPPGCNGLCCLNESVPRNKRKREDSCDEGLHRLAPTDLSSTPTADSTSLTVKSSNSECICLAVVQNPASSESNAIAPTFTDDVIRSHLQPCKCEREDSDCPNVSLSPLVTHNANTTQGIKTIYHSVTCEQRERRSSICSSNDENDSSPDLAGNVLIVSHGGLLKELIRYFVDELGCSLPGGKKQAMRISPNTGLSKFSISLSDNEDDRAKIICHQIHDKHHLDELGLQLMEHPSEGTAL